MSWEQKAKDIAAAHCLESYRQANCKKDGTKYKKHRPYSTPEMAQALVKCLDTNNENEAKRLFEVERLGAWSMI